MLNKVEKTIQKFNLIEPHDRVLVAVSGGADSLALLHCLYRLRDKYALTLIVAHLNHSFRGKDADSDAEYVRQLSQKLGLDHVIKKINVPELLAKKSVSPQEGAREIRYAFLKNTAQQYNCNKVALGHHLDDQAETVLLNLIKGAGLDGLKGIVPKRGIYIRPMIEIKKTELEKYCDEHHLSICIDASNYQDIYLRNKIRNKLLPWLVEEFNPNIVEGLANTAEIVRAENDYLEQLAQMKERDCRVKLDTEKNKGEWSTEGFDKMHISLQRRLIRLITSLVTGESQKLPYNHVEKVRSLILNKISGNVLELPGKIVAIYQYERLKILKKEEYYYSKEPVEFCYELNIPGSVRINEINTVVESRIISPWENMEYFELNHRKEAIISIDPDDSLIIRNRRPGDKINPIGMKGSKKVKDLLIDEKVSKEERDRIPIIVSKKTNKIIWVAGFRLSKDFKNVLGENSVLLRII